MQSDRSQRWRDRRDRWVPNASTINPADYAVDVIDSYRVAKPFVVQHHYSGSFVAARLSVGLFRGRQLVGVAAFSQPIHNGAAPKHAGLHHSQAPDLGRFVLLDDVPGNGETWFLARALSALRREKPEAVAVVSYADPVERVAADGQVVKPGHVGVVYQHLGAVYRGRATPRSEYLTPDGQPFNERAVSKIRTLDEGHAYAVDELVRRGAPRPTLGQDPRAWFADLKASPFFTRRRHPGNHVYVFPRTLAAKQAGKGLIALPYPQKEAA
jgi:hypothetical protein